MIQVKLFEADTLAAAETAANTWLAAQDIKDVLDTIVNSFSSAKYGTNKTYVITVVYKA
jgi:hypothetical protein